MKVDALHAHVVIDGVLNVNKQGGWTSHDVVAKLRTLLRVRRVGHAGTLDPPATGVLPILLGKATRIAEFLVPWDKEYRAVLRLGETTDTQDATGAVLATRSTEGIRPDRIRAVVSGFSGPQRQVPPMYSAVKIKGVPLYKAARSGRTIEREPREIVVHDIDVLDSHDRDVTLRIRCSKGTYVRTLCADIGETLGVGGHVLALERTRVGPLRIEDALMVEQIAREWERGELPAHLMSLDEALGAFPEVVLDQATSLRVLHGVPVPMSGVRGKEGRALSEDLAGRIVRLKSCTDRLLGLGTVPSPAIRSRDRSSVDAVLPVMKVLADPS